MATQKIIKQILYNDLISSRRWFTHFEETLSRILYKYSNQQKDTNKTSGEKGFLKLLINELKSIIQENQKEIKYLEGLSKNEIINVLFKDEDREKAREKASENYLKNQIKYRIERLNTVVKVSLLKRLEHKFCLLPNTKPIDKIIENPYPKVFREKKDFLIFKMYIDRHFVNPYKDLSFIYQELRQGRRVLNKHIDFAIFLKNEGFIKEVHLDEVLRKKGFDNKSSSNERLNNYHKINDDFKDLE
jgi:hypothetical protein